MKKSSKYSVAGGIAFSIAAAVALTRIASARQTLRSSLQGKVVLITGGSRGLGLALAREIGRAGAVVAICARDQAELDRACNILGKDRLSVTPFVVDLSEPENVPSFIESVIQRLGRIDVLINNAGVIRVGPFDSTTSADYEEAMNLMFWAPVNLSRAVLPHMRERGSGSIVNISSVGGRVSIPHLIPYSCAKFALVAFSSGMSAEVKGEGIHVLTVTPGLMRTGSYLNARFAGSAREEFAWFGMLGNLPGFSVGVEICRTSNTACFRKR